MGGLQVYIGVTTEVGLSCEPARLGTATTTKGEERDCEGN